MAKKSEKRILLSEETGIRAEDLKFHWSYVDVEMLATMLDKVTKRSGAVMFTGSRDGSMAGVRIYHDSIEPETLWFRDEGGFEGIVKKVIDVFDNMG